MIVKIPVSLGELVDRITILRIKQDEIRDPDALCNVRQELGWLERAYSNALSFMSAVIDAAGRADLGEAKLTELEEELATINRQLWDIEDAIRAREAAQDFGDAFLHLARSVYKTNDRRSAVKRRINQLLGSEVIEEKSYTAYEEGAV